MKKKFVFFDKSVCFLIAVICAIYAAMIFVGAQSTLDLRMYYTGDEARALFDGFTLQVKNAYFINELLDLVLICSYSSLAFLCLKKAFPNQRLVWCLGFVPGFFDLIETTFVLYALKVEGYHSAFDWLGCATFLKWSLGAVVLSVVIWGSARRQI